MTCGFQNSAGTDLDNIFAVTNSNAGALGFQCSNGQDLGNRYASGSLGISVGFQNSAGTDIGFLRSNKVTKTVSIPIVSNFIWDPNPWFCMYSSADANGGVTMSIEGYTYLIFQSSVTGNGTYNNVYLANMNQETYKPIMSNISGTVVFSNYWHGKNNLGWESTSGSCTFTYYK